MRTLFPSTGKHHSDFDGSACIADAPACLLANSAADLLRQGLEGLPGDAPAMLGLFKPGFKGTQDSLGTATLWRYGETEHGAARSEAFNRVKPTARDACEAPALELTPIAEI